MNRIDLGYKWLDDAGRNSIDGSTSRDLHILKAQSIILVPDESTATKRKAAIPLMRVQHSHDNSTWNNVDESELHRYSNCVAYMGSRRYIRCNVVNMAAIDTKIIEMGADRVPQERAPQVVYINQISATSVAVHLSEPIENLGGATASNLLSLAITGKTVTVSAVTGQGITNTRIARLLFTVAGTAAIASGDTITANFNGNLLKTLKGEKFPNQTNIAVENSI